jgi:apolipoprotein N-acyltransferase
VHRVRSGRTEQAVNGHLVDLSRETVVHRPSTMRAAEGCDRPTNRFALACGAVAASGGLLTLAYPPFDQGWVAWIALVPLLVALRGRSAGTAAFLGLVFAATAELGIFGWLFVVSGITVPRFAVLALYVGLYPTAWCVGIALLARVRVPLVWSAPSLWILLEALRGHMGFLSLTWATLAQSQHADLPLLQLAAWTGEAGLSFVVVLANVALAGLVARRPTRAARGVAASTLLALMALHAAGALVLATSADAPSIRIAAIQPHIGLDERESEAGRAAIWQRLVTATRAADAAGADLIVWPETAIGDPLRDPALADDLARLTIPVHAALIAGSAETEKFTRGDATALVVAQRPKYNSAYLVEHGEVVGEPYRKRVLLPFGEYMPLRGVLSWPSWLVPDDLVDGVPGTDAAPFVVDSGHRAIRVATLICWENAFSTLTRAQANDGAQLVVHLANDAWFGDTAAAAQHDVLSVMRAVESGLPIVVASNDGPSEVIDAHGRVAMRLDRRDPAQFVATTLSLPPAGTFYSRHGDVFIALCALSLLLALPARAARRRYARPFDILMERTS